jgi:hypothetical protein
MALFYCLTALEAFRSLSSSSYFTTGGLPPISSPWRQAPWRSRPEIFFPQLNTWGCSPYVTSSLTRGWLCRLQLLLAFASIVILGSESRGTHDNILLSQIRDSPQPEGPGPCIYILQGQGGPFIPPDTGFPFRRLLRLAGLRWRYSNSPPHGHWPTTITRPAYISVRTA